MMKVAATCGRTRPSRAEKSLSGWYVTTTAQTRPRAAAWSGISSSMRHYKTTRRRTVQRPAGIPGSLPGGLLSSAPSRAVREVVLRLLGKQDVVRRDRTAHLDHLLPIIRGQVVRFARQLFHDLEESALIR